jgi:hypothetical protein
MRKELRRLLPTTRRRLMAGSPQHRMVRRVGPSGAPQCCPHMPHQPSPQPSAFSPQPSASQPFSQALQPVACFFLFAGSPSAHRLPCSTVSPTASLSVSTLYRSPSPPAAAGDSPLRGLPTSHGRGPCGEPGGHHNKRGERRRRAQTSHRLVRACMHLRLGFGFAFSSSVS